MFFYESATFALCPRGPGTFHEEVEASLPRPSEVLGLGRGLLPLFF